jgi:cell wall-associated NlpC family hydrolase
MPPPLRSLLSSFALTAIVLGCAASASPALLKGGRDRSVRPTAIVDKARPERSRAPRTPSLGDRAARMALRAVGVPYRWGGASLESGFDCSGLVYWTYRGLGIELPHSSYALYARGRRVARSRMKPGDLLFFSGLGHVGIYLGHGRMVHAPQTGRTVEVVRLGRSSYGRSLVGARRLTRA